MLMNFLASDRWSGMCYFMEKIFNNIVFVDFTNWHAGVDSMKYQVHVSAFFAGVLFYML